MKKTILFLIIQIILFSNFVLADASIHPLMGSKWDDEDYYSLFVDNFNQEALIELIEIAENSKDEFKVFTSLGLLQGFIASERLRNKVNNNKLAKIIEESFLSINDPKTAKDYFYLGYLATHDIRRIDTKAFGFFDYTINNYPKSDYAEFSYLFSAFAYLKLDKAKALEVLNKYLDKYGETSELRVYAYTLLTFMDSSSSSSKVIKEEPKLFLKYSNKIESEFSHRTSFLGTTYTRLADYYNTKEDYQESLEYSYKVYSGKNFSFSNINTAIKQIFNLYSLKKDYKKCNEFLDKLDKRFFKRKMIRKTYHELKLNLEEINRFGYDERDRITSGIPENDRKIAKKAYANNKNNIEKFRAEYEKCFDKDLNLIKPVRSIKIGLQGDDRNTDKK